MSNYLDTGTGQHVVVDGMIVERDALRVAEAIKDYDPNLEILCVNPEMAGISEEPFVIAERGKDGVLRPVLRAWELNDLVLQRIRFADNQRHNTLKVLEDMEAKQQDEIKSRYNDIREQNNDVISHVLATKQSKYSVKDSVTGDTIIFYDDRPSERK